MCVFVLFRAGEWWHLLSWLLSHRIITFLRSDNSWKYNRTCYAIVVTQLHREFLRAGSDVMQAFTFYGSDDKLTNRGNNLQQQVTVSLRRQLLAIGKGAFTSAPCNPYVL